MSDGKIVIDTDVDSGGATQGISKLSNIVNSSLKGIAASIAGVVATVGGLGGAAVTVGMSFEKSMSQFGSVV